MTTIEVSSKVEKEAWEGLCVLARESHRAISEVLTEAITEYLNRYRPRPAVVTHVEDSIRENQELGELLAK